METNFFDPFYMNTRKLIKLEPNIYHIIGTNNGIDYWQANAKKIKPILILNSYYNFEFVCDNKKDYCAISKNYIDWPDGNRWYRLRH